MPLSSLRKRNLKMNKKFILIIFSIFIINLQSNVFADNKNINNSEEIIGYSENVLGRSKNAKAIDFPNVITLDWTATSSSVNLVIQNTGIDSVDTLSGTVKTGSYSKSFSISNLKTNITKLSIPINMEACLENIVVDYQASDAGSQIVKTTSSGHRQIESVYSSQWHKGADPTLYGAINKHYKKHKLEIGSTNIEAYVRSSITFRSTVNKSPDALVPGATPNVYRWRKNGKYIDLYGAKNTGLIISYGKT